MKAFIDYFETSVATREDKHSYESNTSSAFYLSIPFHKFLSYEKKKKKMEKREKSSSEPTSFLDAFYPKDHHLSFRSFDRNLSRIR